MRALLTAEAMLFLIFGTISGAALTHVIHHRVVEAESKTVAALILGIPLERLGDINIRSE